LQKGRGNRVPLGKDFEAAIRFYYPDPLGTEEYMGFKATATAPTDAAAVTTDQQQAKMKGHGAAADQLVPGNKQCQTDDGCNSPAAKKARTTDATATECDWEKEKAFL
jgi:hypothetical protein